MTKEDKELLLQDLCSRLPYGVKIETEYFTKATLIEIRKNISYGACKDLLVTYDISGEETPYQCDERSDTISKIKPYLFPLSSMSAKQKAELAMLVVGVEDIFKAFLIEVEFYHKHRIDYKGLIEKGLAIDATGLNIY